MINSDKAGRVVKTDNNNWKQHLYAISDVFIVWEGIGLKLCRARYVSIFEKLRFQKISIHTRTFNRRFQIYSL